MIANHFEGSMKQRVERPVLSPLQRLRKIKADRLELAAFQVNDPKPVKRQTAQNLIDLVNTLMG